MPHSDKEKEDEAVNIVNNIRISKKRSADVVVGDHTTIKGRHCLVTYVSLGRTTGYGSANPKTHLQGTDLSTQKKYVYPLVTVFENPVPEEIILQRTLMECFEPIRRRCLLANIERDDGFVKVFEEDGSVCDDLVPVSKFLQKDLSRAFNDGMPVIWVEILKTPYSEEVIAFEKEDD